MNAPTATQLIYRAIDAIDEDRGADQHLAKDANTNLLSLGSMELINFLVALEAAIEASAGIQLRLTEDLELLDESGPLCSVADLTAYLEAKLKQSAAMNSGNDAIAAELLRRE